MDIFRIALTLTLIAIASPQEPRRIGMAGALQSSYAGLKRNITEAADKMPAEDYNSKPGAMPEMRTFAQVIEHIAQGHEAPCGAVRGLPAGAGHLEGSPHPSTKAELTATLAASFALCDQAFSATTDENALEFVKQGPFEVTRATILYGLLAHDAEMYGIATVYLRAKGLVPPSTERQGRGRGRP